MEEPFMKDGTKLLHTTLSREDVGKYAFLPGSPQRVDRIAKYLENPCFVTENREHRSFAGMLEGEKVVVVSTGMGGPSTCICLEELVRLGVRTFIRVGSCATVSPGTHRGDLVIPQAAVRMEGTGLHYAPIEYPAIPDFELLGLLVKAAESSAYPYHTGVVITRDGFYTQSEAEQKPVGYDLAPRWKAYQMMGAIATEMESAPLFIAGASLDVKTACVLVCATEFDNYEEDRDRYPMDFEPRSIQVAIEAMRMTILADRRKCADV